MSSPCAMAWATGAAPRQAGRSEKCRFTHPRRGTSSAACGISAPYAVTGQHTGASARSRRRKPSSRGVGGLSTSRPTSAARSATGLGPTRRPRPAAASGRVMTAATSCRDLSSASSEGTAVAGVPANTRRIAYPAFPVSIARGTGRATVTRTSKRLAPGAVRRDFDLRDRLSPPFRLADLLHRQLPGDRVEPVDEQDAAQVIRLMLDASGQVTAALEGDRLPVHVETPGHHAVGPFGGVGEAGEGQAPLVVGLLLGRQLEIRVDQMTQLVVHVVGEHPQAHPDLWRGQAHAGRVQHGVGQVFDEPAELGVEGRDRVGRGAEHRVAEDADRHNADGGTVPSRSTPFAQAVTVYEVWAFLPALRGPAARAVAGERALNAALRAALATAGSGW